jgi:allantoin racemase
LAAVSASSRPCRAPSCSRPVLDLDTDPNARKVVTEACREAIEAHQSDAVVLGCAGMAGGCCDISAEPGVPVVDGVAAATLTVQSLVTMGLRTSKRGEYATPPVKSYSPGDPAAG